MFVPSLTLLVSAGPHHLFWHTHTDTIFLLESSVHRAPFGEMCSTYWYYIYFTFHFFAKHTRILFRMQEREREWASFHLWRPSISIFHRANAQSIIFNVYVCVEFVHCLFCTYVELLSHIKRYTIFSAFDSFWFGGHFCSTKCSTQFNWNWNGMHESYYRTASFHF